MAERSGPIQKRLDAVGSAGDRAQTNQVNSTFSELVKREIQEPFENLMPGSGLEVRHNERVFTAQGFFNYDILSELLVQVDLESVGKETGQRVVLIVQVHQQGQLSVFSQVGDEELRGSGLAGASLGAGCEKQGA